MILKNEQWHVWDGTNLVLATQEQIDEHFSRPAVADSWWAGDYS